MITRRCNQSVKAQSEKEQRASIVQGKERGAAGGQRRFEQLELMRSERDEAIKALQLAYDVMRGATLTKKQLETALRAAQKILKEYISA